MKKLLIVLTVLTALLFAGCGEIEPPLKFVNASVGGPSVGDSIAVPGGSGMPSSLLNTKYNAGSSDSVFSGKGMRIVNISSGVNADVGEITTQRTLGLWPDNKFHIEGFNTTFNGGFQNAGFNEVSIMYYDQPFADEFKISARVRVIRAGGVSTGKGVHFGAYSNMGKPNHEWGAAQQSKGIGMFLRAEASPQFRLYYSDAVASTTAGTDPMTGAPGYTTRLNALTLQKEYIYEFARIRITPVPGAPSSSNQSGNWDSEFVYTYKIYDSKSGEPVYESTADTQSSPAPGMWFPPYRRSVVTNSQQHPHGTAVGMHAALKGSVYAGVCISGSALEVSQIKIWDSGTAEWDYQLVSGDVLNDDGTITKRDEDGNVTSEASTAAMPIFWTPETIPAYVPAQYLIVTTAPFNLSGAAGTNAQHGPRPGGLVAIDAIDVGSAELSGINVFPTFRPTFAEADIKYEFHYLGLYTGTTAGFTNESVFTITGQGVESTYPGVEGSTWDSGKITINSSSMITDQVAVGLFKVVGRDLKLDVDKTASDYAVLQTLPEYYFRVRVTK